MGRNKNTVSMYLKRLRGYIKEKHLDSLPMIGGPGITVEVDESKFGKRKYNRGHRVDGVRVLGIVERTPKRNIILLIVPDRKAETSVAILKKHVHSNSRIYYDCWRGYFTLSQRFAEHGTVNHSICFKDYITGMHTNTIESNWAGIKKDVPYRCRSRKKYFYT